MQPEPHGGRRADLLRPPIVDDNGEGSPRAGSGDEVQPPGGGLPLQVPEERALLLELETGGRAALGCRIFRGRSGHEERWDRMRAPQSPACVCRTWCPPEGNERRSMCGCSRGSSATRWKGATWSFSPCSRRVGTCGARSRAGSTEWLSRQFSRVEVSDWNVNRRQSESTSRGIPHALRRAGTRPVRRSCDRLALRECCWRSLRYEGEPDQKISRAVSGSENRGRLNSTIRPTCSGYLAAYSRARIAPREWPTRCSGRSDSSPSSTKALMASTNRSIR